MHRIAPAEETVTDGLQLDTQSINCLAKSRVQHATPVVSEMRTCEVDECGFRLADDAKAGAIAVAAGAHALELRAALQVRVPKGAAERDDAPHPPGAPHVPHQRHLGIGVASIRNRSSSLQQHGRDIHCAHTQNCEVVLDVAVCDQGPKCVYYGQWRCVHATGSSCRIQL